MGDKIMISHGYPRLLIRIDNPVRVKFLVQRFLAAPSTIKRLVATQPISLNQARLTMDEWATRSPLVLWTGRTGNGVVQIGRVSSSKDC
jgi:hypothetical protein